MQRGDRFGSYQAFLERFHAYKLAQGSCYGLRSCVRVRCYNLQRRTAIREDVRFIQATFGCAWAQQSNQRSSQQPSLCPACVVLCYREDTDQLEIADLNSLHVHAELVPSLPGAAAITAKPRAGGTEGGSAAGEDVVAGSPVDGAPAPVTSAALPKEKPSSSVLVRVANAVRTFLRADRGSLASLSTGSGRILRRLSFQSSKMRSAMVPFPERLLLHRALGEGEQVLYAFLVEAKQQKVAVAHMSLMRRDTGCSVREMLTVFKKFNPECRKVQTIFVDVSFPHQAVLQELFPSAQVLLPICSTARLPHRQGEAGAAPCSPAQDAVLASWPAKLSPSAAGLGALAQLAPCWITLVPYGSLPTCGFSGQAKGGLHAGVRCRNSLDLLMQRITSPLGKQLALEASAVLLLKHMDCLDSSTLGQLNGGISSTARKCWSSPQEQPAGATVEQRWSTPREQPAGATVEQRWSTPREQPAGAAVEQPAGAAVEQPAGAAVEQPAGATGEQCWSSPGEQPAGATGEQCWSSPPEQPAGATGEQCWSSPPEQPAGATGEQCWSSPPEQPAGATGEQCWSSPPEQPAGATGEQCWSSPPEQPAGATGEQCWSSPPEQPAGATGEQCWSSPPEQPAGAAVELGPSAGFPAELAALRESCSAAGWWLCLREWEVAQASSQLRSPAEGGLAVQLLEEAHRVSRDGRSCTCRFHRQYRLPCRHVLAVLQAHRGRVEEAMVCRRWQRRYQHLPVTGAARSALGRGSVGGREERARSLSLELANLLLQCEGRELEKRSSVLAGVLAPWARAPAPAPGEAAGEEPVSRHGPG